MKDARKTLRKFSQESCRGNRLSSIEKSISKGKNISEGEFIINLKEYNKSRNKVFPLDKDINGIKIIIIIIFIIFIK